MPLTLGGWHKWGCDARQHPRATVCYGEGAPARGGEPVRRRAFISLLGGVAATWPLAAHPQQAGKLPTIGILSSPPLPPIHIFVRNLRDSCYAEGQNTRLVSRFAEGRNRRYS